MSDDNGDAAFEAGASHGPYDQASVENRLDSIHRTLATLGSRIDALVTSTTSYRSALTDRLTEYADLVAKVTRTQSADLEAYQLANEQTVAELRRGLMGSEEVLERVGTRIDSLLAGGGSMDDETRRVLDEVREALLDVASGEVMGALWDELRTAREALDTLVARSDAARTVDLEAGTDEPDPLRTDVTELTEAVRELLQDAEFVDEPSQTAASAAALTSVASDVAALRTELSEGLVVEPSEALAGTVDQLRADLAGLDARMQSINQLREDVADLRAATEAATAQVASAPDGTGAEVSELRTDLNAGLDSLRAGLDGINERLATATGQARPDGMLTAIAADVTALRNELTDRFDALQTGGAEEPDTAVSAADIEGELHVLRTGVEGIDGEVRTLRTGIEDIIARLDEGLVLAEELPAPAAVSSSPETVDQFATLRDQVTTEFDALRQLVTGLDSRLEPTASPAEPAEVDLSAITELLERLRDDVAELPTRIEIPQPEPPPAPAERAAPPSPEYATIDPDAIDLLREEIRAAGGVSDEVIDALRNDLVSLRRRIKLRAEGEILTDGQLELIAEAVARRLAE